MTPLLSDSGRRQLDKIVRPGMLCAFDFDGTLAPIVPHPDQARLPAGMRSLLLRLGEHAPIAIITGRSVADIGSRLGFQPDFLIGNHGLEGVPGQEAEVLRHEAACIAWRAQLEKAVRERAFGEGIFIEDKRYSLSVHYREAGDRERAAAKLHAFFAQLDPPPRVVAGKAIYSLMPQDAGHKGSALEQVMAVSGARSALYAGDDVTDEDVFRLPRPDLLCVRIEPSTDTAAGFFLPGVEDMAFLLEELAMRLQAAGAVNWRRQPATGTL